MALEKLNGIEPLYFKMTDLWKRFCELHFDLYELTCDEYKCLIESKIPELEDIVKSKEAVIKKIQQLDSLRQKLMKKINLSFFKNEKIKSAKDLISIFNDFDIKSGSRNLSKYNVLLKQMIEKIAIQNKRNLLFLNKAMNAINPIIKKNREILGKKTFNTYTPKGEVRQSP